MALWAVIYAPALFRPALLDDADSVHAEAAREMVQRGDWVTMYANGIRYLEKAPLMYWGMASSFKLLGVGEWQARLPLTLGALALLLALYGLGQYAFGGRAGLYAAMVMATSFGPFIFTRILIPDLLVGLWLTLGLWFFLRIVDAEDPARNDCWGFTIVAALSVLTKGLIGLVFPLAIVGAYLLFTGGLRRLRHMHLLSSAAVFLLVAAPWHVLAAVRNPAAGQARGFLWFYFVNEHFLRYLNKRIPHDYDTVPLLLFWGLIFVWLMPWSAFLPQTVASVFRRTQVAERAQRASLLFSVWAVLVLAFFSFSTRQEYYLLPALPALALLIGGWLKRESDDADDNVRQSGIHSALVLAAIGAVAMTIALIFVVLSLKAAPAPDLSSALKQNPSEYTLSFGHIFDLTPQALTMFRLPLLLTGLALGLGTSASWWLRRKRRPFAGNCALAAMMVVVLLSAWVGLIRFSPELTSKDFAAIINQRYRAGDTIVIRGEYQEGSTLNFYTGKQVHILRGHIGLWYGSLFPDAPAIWETPASFQRTWEGGNRVFLWSTTLHPDELAGRPVYELAHGGGKYLLSNQP